MNRNIRELFEAAILLPEQDRAAFIDAQCADLESANLELRATLRRMLEVDQRSFEQPSEEISDAIALSAAIGETKPVQHEIGSQVGPFTIEERIGDGGSSVIYRASREIAGARQVVALKILRRGMYSPEVRRLFDRERKALAALQHPFIAQFIDGGVEPSGQAYLALELVDGVPITEYARSKTLDFRTRLKLFEQVARAVAAAHRALIVHRDLKPANVMITHDGHVKLLDFGIAKILSDELDLTRTEFQAFTPAYAAPEQRDGGAITTATDVYSLGILLGELLTGQRVNDGNSHTPSTRITEDTPQGVLPSTPQQTRKLLRGDLDNIVLKAMEAEPERRYASAGEFADDIERLLDGRPVTAHPPSTWYRASKFVRRHRISFALGSLSLLGLLAASGVALWQASVARAQTAQAVAVRDFLYEAYYKAEPAAGQALPTIVDLLNVSVDSLRLKSKLPPIVQVELGTHLTSALQERGEFGTARTLIERTVQLAKDNPEVPANERHHAILQLALLEQNERRPEQARAWLDQMLAESNQVDPMTYGQALMLSSNVAADGRDFARGMREAELGYQICLDHRSDSLPEAKRCTTEMLVDFGNDFGVVLMLAGERERSLRVLEDTLASAKVLHGAGHSRVVGIQVILARAYLEMGNAEKARQFIDEALALDHQIYPAGDWRIGRHMQILAGVQRLSRDYPAALETITQATEIQRLALGENSSTVFGLAWMGRTHWMMGKPDLGQQKLGESLQLAEKVLGPDSPDTAMIRSTLGYVQAQSGAKDAGLAKMRTALAQMLGAPKDIGTDADAVLEQMGVLALLEGKGAEALAHYAQLEEVQRGKSLDQRAWAGRLNSGLAWSHLLLQQNADAARALGMAAGEIAAQTFPDRDVELNVALLELWLAQNTQAENVEALRKKAAQSYQALPWPQAPAQHLAAKMGLISAQP